MRSFIILLILVMCLAGCARDSIVYSDSFVPEQDMQHGFINEMWCGITETTDGYYFLSGTGRSFLYFYDKRSKKATPVCNKPDCLHADESDGSKMKSCNSLLFGPTFLQYYLGHIYYVAIDNEANALCESVYMITTDGTSRKKLMDLKESPHRLQIHRGSIFYTTNDSGTVPGQEDNSKTTYRLYRFDMNKQGAKPEIIVEGSNAYGNIGNVICYGNYVYYHIRYLDEDTFNTSLNRYDIQTKKSEKILEKCSASFTIFQNHIVYSLGKTGLYGCGLDGKGLSKVSDLTGDTITANDRYLFIDNPLLSIAKSEERTLTIMDSDWKIVKTVSLKGTREYPYGCSSEYYFVPQERKSNDVGEIMTLSCIPVDKASEDMTVQSFHEFIPTVPFCGFTS